MPGILPDILRVDRCEDSRNDITGLTIEGVFSGTNMNMNSYSYTSINTTLLRPILCSGTDTWTFFPIKYTTMIGDDEPKYKVPKPVKFKVTE